VYHFQKIQLTTGKQTKLAVWERRKKLDDPGFWYCDPGIQQDERKGKDLVIMGDCQKASSC